MAANYEKLYKIKFHFVVVLVGVLGIIECEFDQLTVVMLRTSL